MEKELAKIEKELKALYDRKIRITTSLEKKAEPALIKKFVGKCYKVKNSYNKKERWWLYKKVTSVADGCIVTFDFEATSKDRFEARVNDASYHQPETDWIEISSDQYRVAFLDFIAQMAKKVGSTE